VSRVDAETDAAGDSAPSGDFDRAPEGRPTDGAGDGRSIDGADEGRAGRSPPSALQADNPRSAPSTTPAARNAGPDRRPWNLVVRSLLSSMTIPTVQSPLRAFASSARGEALRSHTRDAGQVNGAAGPSSASSSNVHGTAGRSDERATDMAIGPVQLIVLGFQHPDFHGEIIAELERLRASDTVRVIDALAVYKDKDGELEVEHLSNLSQDEAVELGSKVGALIGLGIEGEEGFVQGALAGAEAAADGVQVFSDQDAWDVIQEIPNDSAAALLLVEHHWAVPLRDAVMRAGGFRISDGFISPLDLVEIGLVSAEEGKQLHHLETSAAASAA
jgi:uncharacterized membrane protein